MSKNKTRNRQPRVVSNLIRFIGLNAALALVPLGTSILVRQLGEVLTPPGIYAPEILFFSVSISATALGDLTNERYTENLKWLFDLLKITLIVGITVSALFFGFYQYESIIAVVNNKIRNNITPFSVTLAITMFIVSIVSEIVISSTKEY